MARVDGDADIDWAAAMSTASVKRRAAVEYCGEPWSGFCGGGRTGSCIGLWNLDWAKVWP